MRGTPARRTMCKTRAERTMPTLLRRTAAQPALVRFGPSYPAESHMEIFGDYILDYAAGINYILSYAPTRG